MKRIATIIAAMLVCAASFAQSGKDIYNKFSDKPKVSAVYISPSMFRLMGKLPEIDMPEDDIDIAPVVKELSGMYIIDSESNKVNAALKTEVEKLLKSGKFELLLEAREDGELVRIYTSGDEQTVTSFVMTSVEKDESVFICLEGRIGRADLEKLIASSVK